MKNRTSWVVIVAVIVFSASMAHAAPMQAVGLEKVCRNYNGTTHSVVLHPIKSDECATYVKAWADGISSAGIYKFNTTIGQIVRVFNVYIANHPEELNKPAGDVLLHAMTNSGLFTSGPGQGQGQASDH